MTPSIPLVSIVLGSYNRRAFLQAALESVRANGMDFAYEIIVVDGGSTDGSLRYLTAQKDVITIVQHNRGNWRGKPIERRNWGYFMNLGFKCAQGKYICMISDDSLLIPGALKNGVEYFEQLLSEGRKVGALAFYWREWPIEKEYKVGITFGKLFVNHGLFLRDAVMDLGGFDEVSYRFYHADGDFCLRLWQHGYEVAVCPDAYVEHFSHANLQARKSNNFYQQADWQVYSSRWQRLQMDSDGGWILKKFFDSRHTYLKFPLLARILVDIKQTAQILLQRTRAKSQA